MEIEQLDFDGATCWNALNVSDAALESISLHEAMQSSSSSSGWRRLKSENLSFPPNIDPLWLNDTGDKFIDLDADLDDEIYEQTKRALKFGIPSLKDHSISNEELDALAPLVKKILDLATPTDHESKAKQKKKIELLGQLANRQTLDDAARKLVEKEVEELKASANILVAAKGKQKKGFGYKVAKFWKKHKKAIIITAAVVAVAAAVVVVVTATGAGAAAGAAAAGGAAGGALADSDHKEKPHLKPNLPPISSQPLPTTQPTYSYPFQTFDQHSFPGKIHFGETGVYCDGQFTSYEDTLHNPPSITDKSWLNGWLHPAEMFPTQSHSGGVKPAQPTISDIASPSSPDVHAFAFQARGDWALTAGYNDQALKDFNEAIEIEPNNPTSYLGRGVAHFELGQYDACIADYNEYTALAPTQFSLTDFSIGFAKGLPKGIYESGEGMLLFLSDLVTSPIQTGSQVYHSFSTLSSLVNAGEWEAVGASLSPEVHELVTQWETLSDNKKGELAGYAFGKHGADILLPGAAAKITAKGITAVKELGSVCKNLQSAEKVFVLEAITKGSNAGINVGEVMSSAQKTLIGGEDLGLTTKQMANLKQAGALEQTVGKGRDFFAGNPEMQASYDFIKSAETALEAYVKKIMPETEIRKLIEQTGVKTFPRTQVIPENYLVTISDSGAGMKYIDPTNSGTYYRVMPGKPHSPNSFQQKPYVNRRINGRSLDKYGNIVPHHSPKAHIPLEEFLYGGK